MTMTRVAHGKARTTSTRHMPAGPPVDRDAGAPIADGFANGRERETFERFRAELAPRGWTIAHNLYLRRQERRGAGTRELDLVALHPRHGVLVVEVKGGAVERRSDGTWLQNGQAMPRNPEQQANEVRAMLIEALRASELWATAGIQVPPMVIMLAFPDVEAAPRAMASLGASAGLAPGQVVDRVTLNRDGSLSAAVEQVVDGMLGRQGWQDPGFDWVDLALRVISPELRFSTSLVGDLEVDRARLAADERVHRDWVDNLAVLPRVHFEGGAGAGKSVLARLRARALAESGARVLFVCSTAGLAKAVQTELRGVSRGRVTADTLHQALITLARETGDAERLGIPAAGEPTIDQLQGLPGSTAGIVAATPRRFDALVVDEAQDVPAGVLRDLTGLLEDPVGGSVWTFGDAFQRLGPDWAEDAPDHARTIGGIALTMRQNHRNPHPILQLAEGLRADDTARSSRRGGGGARSVDYRAITERGERATLEQVLGELADQRIERGRIAVVSMARVDHNPLFLQRRVGPWMELDNPQLDANGARIPRSADALPAPDPGKVYFDSVRRMKGLERGVIVLVDVPDPGPPGSIERRLLYLAVTRATTHLVVIAPPGRLERLRAIAATR